VKVAEAREDDQLAQRRRDAPLVFPPWYQPLADFAWAVAGILFTILALDALIAGYRVLDFWPYWVP
jgi:hypothetical protein